MFLKAQEESNQPRPVWIVKTFGEIFDKRLEDGKNIIGPRGKDSTERQAMLSKSKRARKMFKDKAKTETYTGLVDRWYNDPGDGQLHDGRYISFRESNPRMTLEFCNHCLERLWNRCAQHSAQRQYKICRVGGGFLREI